MAYERLGQLGNAIVLQPSNTVNWENIVGGTITAEELILAGGVTSSIRSQNYNPAPGSQAGWAIFGDGSAFFYGNVTLGADAIVIGDLYSSNWNGTIPANLATVDTGADAGYYLDSSVGTMQLEGNLFVGGNIELDAGVFKTNTGEPRIEMNANEWEAQMAFFVDSTTYDGLYISAFGDDTPAVPAGLTTYAGISATNSGLAISTTYGDVFIGSTGTGGITHLYGNAVEAGSYGTAALPFYTFGARNTDGLYSASSNNPAMSAGGTRAQDWHKNGSTMQSRFTNGTSTIPSITFISDSDTGFRNHTSNQIGIILGGQENVSMRGGTENFVLEVTKGNLYLDVMEANHDFYIRTHNGTAMKNRIFIDGSANIFNFYTHDGATEAILAAGLWRTNDGSAGTPAHSFRNDTNIGMYRYGTDEIGWATAGTVKMRIRNSTASVMRLRDGLTDVGNHETLRLNRGTGTTTQYVGYYSSWAYTKTDIKDLADPRNPWWKREWFMDIETVSSRKKKNTEAFRGQEDMRTISFLMDNLIENTNLLTTKGIRVGDAPDEHAILAVTVDYVQHLERRLAALEAQVAQA